MFLAYDLLTLLLGGQIELLKTRLILVFFIIFRVRFEFLVGCFFFSEGAGCFRFWCRFLSRSKSASIGKIPQRLNGLLVILFLASFFFPMRFVVFKYFFTTFGKIVVFLPEGGIFVFWVDF